LSFLSWFILILKGYEFQNTQRQITAFSNHIHQKKGFILDKKIADTFVKSPLFTLFATLKNATQELLEKNQTFSKDRSYFLTRYDVQYLESLLEQKLHQQTKTLDQNLFILSTSISLAPFLGILGTVWGLLVSLSGLAKGASALSNQVVMSGLSTALATTVLGLLIAIPALIGFNYLKSSLKQIHHTMHDFGQLMLREVEMGYRRE
jgi:biopolymer transport protein TolQ